MRLDDAGNEVVKVYRCPVAALEDVTFCPIAALLTPQFERHFHLIYQGQGCNRFGSLGNIDYTAYNGATNMHALRIEVFPAERCDLSQIGRASSTVRVCIS